MKSSSLALVLVSFLSAAGIAQQPSNDDPQKNIMVIGELTHAIDAKKAKVGDQVTLRLVHNLGRGGKILVPYKKGKVIGHITQVQQPTKENSQSMVAIQFDKIEVKGGSDLPITATIRSMVPPFHTMIRQDTGSIPTSGDNPTARAGGPIVDSYGRTVSPPPAPLTQPGPKAAASGASSPGIDGIDFEPNPETHTTVITANKKSLWIEDHTRITLVVQSSVL